MSQNSHTPTQLGMPENHTQTRSPKCCQTNTACLGRWEGVLSLAQKSAWTRHAYHTHNRRNKKWKGVPQQIEVPTKPPTAVFQSIRQQMGTVCSGNVQVPNVLNVHERGSSWGWGRRSGWEGVGHCLVGHHVQNQNNAYLNETEIISHCVWGSNVEVPGLSEVVGCRWEGTALPETAGTKM